jgi:hypothetical protein
MPEGPLGFPRLTTLGPLVKPSKIRPHKDITEGTYDIGFIEDEQAITGEDTRRAMRDILEYDLDVRTEFRLHDVIFRYHKRQISEIISINEFSSSLLETMSRAEDEGIPLKAERVSRVEIKNEPLYDEVERHMKGEDSIFTDKLLGGIDAQWKRVKNGDLRGGRSEGQVREDIIDKVVDDFDRVMDINESIREDRIYYPPTTEDIELGGVVGWGTIDGAHRVVALSQILGTDAEIYVWEWDNQKDFVEQSPRV